MWPGIWLGSSAAIGMLYRSYFYESAKFDYDSGVHPTLYSKCHHQIINSKLTLKLEYPPLYDLVVWYYDKA